MTLIYELGHPFRWLITPHHHIYWCQRANTDSNSQYVQWTLNHFFHFDVCLFIVSSHWWLLCIWLSWLFNVYSIHGKIALKSKQFHRSDRIMSTVTIELSVVFFPFWMFDIQSIKMNYHDCVCVLKKKNIANFRSAIWNYVSVMDIHAKWWRTFKIIEWNDAHQFHAMHEVWTDAEDGKSPFLSFYRLTSFYTCFFLLVFIPFFFIRNAIKELIW